MRARVFPRGMGEMTTRSPIQVTLSDGAEHVAQFKDSGRVYRLDREQELEEMRRDIESRMGAALR